MSGNEMNISSNDVASTEGKRKKRWYVVHVYSGSENFVVQALKEQIALSDLASFFGDILVPTEEVIEMRGGQKKRGQRKFFPGYVLVEMEMDSQTWYLVRKIPKVLGFIGGDKERPAPLSKKEIDNIQGRIAEGVDKPKPKILFEVGEVVRIIEGPFTEFNGVVEEVNYTKNRLHVAVLIFGRSTPVELEFGQVKKT